MRLPKIDVEAEFHILLSSLHISQYTCLCKKNKKKSQLPELHLNDVSVGNLNDYLKPEQDLI